MTPEGWALRPLASLVSPLRDGVSVNSEDRQRQEGEFGVLKTSALSGGQFNPGEHKTVLADEVDRVKTSPIKGDILISRMNTPRLVGENAYVPDDFPNLFLPDRLWQMRVKKVSDTSSRWLAYFLQLPSSRDYVRDAAGGTIGSMKNVSQEAFLALEVLCPPLPEQKKIAEILGSVDEAIQATQAVIDQTRKVKQGLLQQLLTRGIGHTRFKQTEIGQIPESWEVARLDSVCSKIVDGVHKKPDYVDAGIPFLTVKNLTAGPGISFADTRFVSEEDHLEFTKRAAPERGDILVSKDGTLGVTRLIETDRPFSIFVSVALLKPLRAKVLPNLLRHALEADVIARQFLLNQAGSALKHIHLVDFRRTLMPLPPLTEQERLVGRISAIDQLERTQPSELQTLDIFKRGLMQDLLTGRVRVSSRGEV